MPIFTRSIAKTLREGVLNVTNYIQNSLTEDTPNKNETNPNSSKNANPLASQFEKDVKELEALEQQILGASPTPPHSRPNFSSPENHNTNEITQGMDNLNLSLTGQTTTTSQGPLSSTGVYSQDGRDMRFLFNESYTQNRYRGYMGDVWGPGGHGPKSS